VRSGVIREARKDGKARHMEMSSADATRVFATEGSRKHVNNHSHNSGQDIA